MNYKVVKGTRDFLPFQMQRRNYIFDTIKDVYCRHGFQQIETPALENLDTLMGKYGEEGDKLLFKILNSGDFTENKDLSSGNYKQITKEICEKGLRYDLTVPFARFVVNHLNDISFPFKRYHIAKVWRGEKPQAGRYREFVQCDFDCVGSDSAASDFEILSLMKSALEAIGVKDITIKMSHRGVFNLFLEQRNLTEKSEEILRTVDKLAKIGQEEVTKLLEEITGSNKTAQEILTYITALPTFDETLAQMESLSGGQSEHSQRLREIRQMMIASGIESSFVLDPSITRGLDYYTGVVYETNLNKLANK